MVGVKESFFLLDWLKVILLDWSFQLFCLGV